MKLDKKLVIDGAIASSETLYWHCLVYVKRSKECRRMFFLACSRCHVISEHNDTEGFPSPVHSDVIRMDGDGRKEHCYELFVPVAFLEQLDEYTDIPTIVKQGHINRKGRLVHSEIEFGGHSKPIIAIEKIMSRAIPHGMGKLSPVGQGNRRTKPFLHSTGIASPSDRNCIVAPHMQPLRKLKSKGKATRSTTVIIRETDENCKVLKRLTLPHVSNVDKKAVDGRKPRVFTMEEIRYTEYRLNYGDADCFNGSHI